MILWRRKSLPVLVVGDTADIKALLLRSEVEAVTVLGFKEENRLVGSKSKRLSIEDLLKISAASSALSIPISSCKRAGSCMKWAREISKGDVGREWLLGCGFISWSS